MTYILTTAQKTQVQTYKNNGQYSQAYSYISSLITSYAGSSVSDGHGGTDTAAVNVTVNEELDPLPPSVNFTNAIISSYNRCNFRLCANIFQWIRQHSFCRREWRGWRLCSNCYNFWSNWTYGWSRTRCIRKSCYLIRIGQIFYAVRITASRDYSFISRYAPFNSRQWCIRAKGIDADQACGEQLFA